MEYNKEQIDVLQKANTIEDYLLAVKPFTKNHMVIICSNDTPCGSSMFTSQLGNLFCDTFGIKTNLYDKLNHSYAAVIDSGFISFEDCTKDLIDYSFAVNDTQFRIVSSNAELALTRSQWDDLEDTIGISIGDKNFSYPRRMKQERKISILLYNKENEIFNITFIDGYTGKLLQTFINPTYMDSYSKHDSLNIFFPCRTDSNKVSLYDTALSKRPKQFEERCKEPAVSETAPFGRRIYALMTGSIRNQYDMFAIIYLILDYVERGIIEGLIWSTWSGEPEIIPGLRERLNSLGVMIVETQMPGPVSSNQAQKSQIRNGLYVIPDDAWVIRVRTDFTLNYFISTIYALCNVENLDITEVNNIPQMLNKKIICGLYISKYPHEGRGSTIFEWAFYFPDFCFAATKNDMLLMTNITNDIHLFGVHYPPEVTFCGGPFLYSLPLMSEYFYFLSQYTPRFFKTREIYTCDLLKAMLLNIDDADSFMLPSFLEKTFSVLFPLYYGHFYFADVVKTPEDIEGDIDFVDIFTEIGGGNKRVPRHTLNHWHLQKLINGQVRPSAGYTRFLKTYNRVVSDWSFAKNLHLTPDDMWEASTILAERGYNPVVTNPWLAKVGSFQKSDNKLLAKKSEYLFDFLDDNEREQIVSIYDKHLNYPDYNDRILRECETNSELLPGVVKALILGLAARYDFLLPLSKYPNTYLKFARLITKRDSTEAEMHALAMVRLDVSFFGIVEETILSPIHLAANYLIQCFFDADNIDHPIYVPIDQYKPIGPKFVDLIRETTGVTEDACGNSETASATILDIVKYKIATDENWEHIDKFREFLKLIEQ